jgi:hypothetical protein
MEVTGMAEDSGCWWVKPGPVAQGAARHMCCHRPTLRMILSGVGGACPSLRPRWQVKLPVMPKVVHCPDP